ncbi:MAG: DoxX family protein [Bacteroidota bacterium]|nr:DoxX family protein [Bacteroidota bacterium]
MKIAAIIIRVLMGLMFAFASIAYFFKLVPQPELTGDIKTFMEGIEASVYLMTTVKIFELLCAIAFLSGRFVPLAAVVIFPINLNILLFHIFLDPSSLLIAVLLMVGNLFLAYYYRDKYKPMLAAK